MVDATLIEVWADLLRYPADGGRERIRRRLDELSAAAPDLQGDLQTMSEYAESRCESELEEVFTKTFDSNAERALELGWHLHGENYARGAFMVRMRALLREHGVEERGELPDHVSHVLPVLARAPEDLAAALARGVVSPALDKIAEGFADEANPYYGVITSLRKYLASGYGAEGEDEE
jgi:nitrate reductase delta subunit